MSFAELERSRLEELAASWLAAWGSGAGFAACCTPDITYEDPLTPELLTGLDELESRAGRLRRTLPDLRLERSAEPLAGGAGGEFVCLPWRLAGTHRGSVGELPATERFLVVQGVHYAELADGRIRRARGFYDLYDVAVQLGLMPGRGSLAESTLLLLRGLGFRRRGRV